MKFTGQIINETLLKLFEENEKLYHLGEDTIDPYGGAFKITKGLSTKFPERIITTPISEASITGFANGMALNGFLPIVEIMFGDFISLAFDQILNHLSKFKQMYNSKLSPKVVIRTPSGGYRGYGPTHSQSLEKYLVGIPGIQVVSISDIHDLEKLYRYAIFKEKNPVIIIENKSLYSSIYRNGMLEKEGFSSVFTEEAYPSAILNLNKDSDPDLTILSYGGLAKTAREIIKDRAGVKNENIQLIVISDLNHFNIGLIEKYLNKSKKLLILEEGTQSFGLSAEYAFRLKSIFSGEIRRIGAKDYAIPTARHLEDVVLPSKELINKEIDKFLGDKHERS